MVGDLGVQQLDAAGQSAQADRGGGSLDIPSGLLPEPPTGGDQARRGQATQPSTEAVGGGDNEGVELALGVARSLDRRAAGGRPHRHRRAMTSRSGLGELVTTQGFAGRPDRIQGVGPGAVAAGGPLGSVQLHHPLGLGMEEAGQAGAVATGAFDRPHPPTVVSVGELQQLPVAGRGGRHGHLLEHGAANGLNDRGGVGVLVGVDPDGRARPLPACASR